MIKIGYMIMIKKVLNQPGYGYGGSSSLDARSG